MIAPPPRIRRFPIGTDHAASRRRGFSLTELLVVIGIIVVMAGLLLVALGQVQKRAKQTRTEATMNQFANACMAFQAEHGFYPGVIPDDVLLNHEINTNMAARISSTENALLHLMGGYRVLTPMDPDGGPAHTAYMSYGGHEITFGSGADLWRLKVDVRRIGEGPIINGKPYAPYFTPGTGEFGIAEGQANDDPDPTRRLPDLLDGWGQPVVYLRQARGQGPIVGSNQVSTPRPQFMLNGLKSYLSSQGLGSLQRPQDEGILFVAQNEDWQAEQRQMFAAVLAHPAFYRSSAPLESAARGGFVVISSGPDGVFFAKNDGPGAGTPITTPQLILSEIVAHGPRIIDEFDDIRVFGGN
jgi:prepilin-type N-terminal cleavage/methylation domain-containing protein